MSMKQGPNYENARKNSELIIPHLKIKYLMKCVKEKKYLFK